MYNIRVGYTCSYIHCWRERGGDGKVFGKEYFACDQGHAVFTSRKKVAVLPGYGATARETQASARESELEAALAASQAEVLQLRAELAGYKQNATEWITSTVDILYDSSMYACVSASLSLSLLISLFFCFLARFLGSYTS